MAQEHQPLRLRIEDSRDMAVIASMVQDSLMALCDASYLAAEKSFIFILNRFCWEDAIHKDDMGDDKGHFKRIHTALRFDNVTKVQIRHMDRKNKDAIHNLLTVDYDDEMKIIILHFAGGGAIRLQLTSLNCIVEDMGDAWPSLNKPTHVAGR